MIWVNIESSDGLVPDSTNPFSWKCTDYTIEKAYKYIPSFSWEYCNIHDKINLTPAFPK